ncbi:hypothetical protein GN244_ATG14497 [Phytophthora infestans]|uniref:Crinkler effector protein N-terminal domain-containing protein n=1 Tax=Phytophthora infestans TaxID=4787 RepID=A0A833S5M1_PHYIN|nr:hypothetical protein GN244_ATG14497 [Phytophthora infestans]KAF4137143.1 hypothetical protein GN958_ATG13672 [Phytophthora infestans]
MSGALAEGRHSSRSPNAALGIHIAQLKVAHNREITQLKDDFHNRVIAQLEAAYGRKMASLKRTALERPRESSGDAQPKRSRVVGDEIALVCAVQGTHESGIAIAISANALVRDLAEKICIKNASQLGNIAAKHLDVRRIAQLAKKWTSFDKDSCVVMGRRDESHTTFPPIASTTLERCKSLRR